MEGLDIKKMIELSEDADYIMQFLEGMKKPNGDIEVVLTLVITKYLYCAMKSFEEEGIEGRALKVLMVDFRTRFFALCEKAFMLHEDFSEEDE